MSDWFIGLMSGTSLDGVDAVLVDFNAPALQVLGAVSAPFPAPLRAEFLRLNTSGADELHRGALAANALARLYADVSLQLLHRCGVSPSHIQAIGAHGQTVRHRPGLFDGVGYTLQLNQPALLAELTGIDVVADFRSRDVAAGGQGAPLVPPFHQAVFGHLPGVTGVLNLGGMANLTVLDAQAPHALMGFDCGPGNALMDAWCQEHTGAPFDAGGAWAASGTVSKPLLARMLDEPFFRLPPPKSTGRDLFNTTWLGQCMAGGPAENAANVQATLTELTAQSCAASVCTSAPDCAQLIVCGGGALNTHLMRRIQALLPHCRVSDSGDFGLPALQVEATAFAWLARQCVMRNPGNRISVTGARGERVIGAIYPR